MIIDILFGWALANLTVVTIFGAQLLLGGRRLRYLCDIGENLPTPVPRVSVIIAARNEATNVEAGIRSLLASQYPDFELIAVNDRSTDETGQILHRLADEFPLLRVIDVTELPSGWLGKNHAQHLAASQATGAYLLFTDADVVMEPTSLQRAVCYAETERFDHVAVIPRAVVPGWLLQGFVAVFSMFFAWYMRPWSARRAGSSAYIGIGAFNMVRAESYRAVGGHEKIAMRPDDDIKLGKVIKMHGLRQDVLKGANMLTVPWYESVGQMIRGLEKNSFAIVQYNLLAVVASSLGLLVVAVWPFVALTCTDGATWWINLVGVSILLLLCTGSAVSNKSNPWVALAFPLVVLLLIFVQFRSTFLTLKNQGIQWRDTHYPLSELKANRV